MRPCARLGIEYSFTDFGNTEKLGEYLIRILFLIDADESLLSSVASIFGIKLHNYYMNVWANMIRLGYIKEARRQFESNIGEMDFEKAGEVSEILKEHRKRMIKHYEKKETSE